MAKRSNKGRTHVSPGIYYKEVEIPYSTQSLGITTLGLAGETLKGPAFQSIPIEDWSEYQAYFGGTSTEKYRGSQYPKYELPYIAQEYLKQSKQLEVVRVLGLSGVNAGPAWVLTATKYDKQEGYKYERTESECTKEVELTSENFNKTVLLSVPKDVTESEKETAESPVQVIDAYRNNAVDIMYINDDQAEEYFDTLPAKMKEHYVNFEGLKESMSDSGEEEAFIFIDFNNGIADGKFIITYDDIMVFNPLDREDCSDDYYLGLKKDIDVILEGKISTYAPEKDFNINRFKVYQFSYTNEDEKGNRVVEESGLTCEYELNVNPTTIYTENTESKYANVAIAILRSRGEHKNSVPTGVTDECGNMIYTHDGIEYYAKKVSLTPSTTMVLGDDCEPGYNTQTGDFNIDTLNYGKFNIAVDSIKGCELCGIDSYVKHEYSVSLNPTDKNYITKVLGTDPEVGDADVYVEELYDVALEQLIYANEINAINHEVVNYPSVNIVPDHEPVNDLLTMDSSNLSRKHVGNRYLYTYSESLHDEIKVKISTDNGQSWPTEELGKVGHIYTVISKTNSDTGKKEYFYGEYRAEDGGLLNGNKKFTEYLRFYQFDRDVVKENYILRNCVKNLADGKYYIYTDFEDGNTANEGDVMPITLDFNNYKEEYRYASTPWIVSEIKGSGENITLHKLFRFHTISDGDSANTEVKISIENIDPENETFDVVVRSFYDSDYNTDVLERFGKCSLVPGTDNYIGLKIGTFDEQYSIKSSYITVEINEDDVTSMSIPCGFLGYPVRNYSGLGLYQVDEGSLSSNVKQPYMEYNTLVDEDIKAKKQYFGMSDIIGIDSDILRYHGVEAYDDDPKGMTPCFHLDSRILNGVPEYDSEKGVYYVEDSYETTDGEEITNRQVVNVDEVTGYTWITVSKNNLTDEGIEPRIGLDEVMEGTIYEDKNLRKFTVCFYGGWDGWDYYRTSRSNGDNYRYNKYKGSINKVSGQGTMFSIMKNPEVYGFDSDEKVITSDYYAYLAAYKQLDNPKTISLNLLATPGIDYVNQKLLSQDVIDMTENERGDVLYVMTTPDKPFGAGDGKFEMYTPEEAVYNLEDAEIDSNYACTYYPWVKYYDQSNNQYVYLPVTRDVVRNIAYTDNVAFSWYAAAGWNRGDISGEGPKRKLKLGEQDTLYDGRINFINSFAKEGNKIWGDKNLQAHEGVMDRISKRRLLLRIKKLLSTACISLIFDPNDVNLGDTFKSSVKSVLEPIKTNRGIVDYKIEVDTSDEARDRLELPAKIWIKPTQLLEYIDISLIVTPNGVTFE